MSTMKALDLGGHPGFKVSPCLTQVDTGCSGKCRTGGGNTRWIQLHRLRFVRVLGQWSCGTLRTFPGWLPSPMVGQFWMTPMASLTSLMCRTSWRFWADWRGVSPHLRRWPRVYWSTYDDLTSAVSTTLTATPPGLVDDFLCTDGLRLRKPLLLSDSEINGGWIGVPRRGCLSSFCSGGMDGDGDVEVILDTSSWTQMERGPRIRWSGYRHFSTGTSPFPST